MKTPRNQVVGLFQEIRINNKNNRFINLPDVYSKKEMIINTKKIKINYLKYLKYVDVVKCNSLTPIKQYSRLTPHIHIHMYTGQSS